MPRSLGQAGSCFRRRTSRHGASDGVYVLWSCNGREELAPVRDLSLGGLFIESPVEEDIGAVVKLYFLADEGQICASAVVRHVRRGQGLGLKFTAINDKHCPHLVGLMERLRNQGARSAVQVS